MGRGRQHVGVRWTDLFSGIAVKSPASSRANLAALIAVVILVGLILWVAEAILAHNRLQNCIDSGRRDCLPVEAPRNG